MPQNCYELVWIFIIYAFIGWCTAVSYAALDLSLIHIYTRNGGGGLCRWAPTIDMERDPRWGRTEESYGEDPYLTGEMAGAYIRGMRGEDCLLYTSRCV